MYRALIILILFMLTLVPVNAQENTPMNVLAFRDGDAIWVATFDWEYLGSSTAAECYTLWNDGEFIRVVAADRGIVM